MPPNPIIRLRLRAAIARMTTRVNRVTAKVLPVSAAKAGTTASVATTAIFKPMRGVTFPIDQPVFTGGIAGVLIYLPPERDLPGAGSAQQPSPNKPSTERQ